jgi:polyisoprenoid-binding protein YceI
MYNPHTADRPPRRWNAAVALAALGSAAVWAAGLGIDSTHSTLTATFKQEGVPVDAPFTKFGGQIAYDEAHPEKTTAAIDVQTASIDLGSPAYSAELAKPDWFDSSKYPQASFRSTAVHVVSPNHLEATGTLTLKGKALPITVAITVGMSGAQKVFDGTHVMSRKAFAIGNPDWDSVLEDKVSVKFHFVGAAR